MYHEEEDFASNMMTVAQVAEFFKISKTTLYKWLREGIFPQPKFAPSRKLKRWAREDVLAWSKGPVSAPRKRSRATPPSDSSND